MSANVLHNEIRVDIARIVQIRHTSIYPVALRDYMLEFIILEYDDTKVSKDLSYIKVNELFACELIIKILQSFARNPTMWGLFSREVIIWFT